METRKGAVIYARYSSDKQTEQSIEGQLTVCKKYAEDNDLMVVDTYIDRAMTGTNDNRVAFQQMLADSEKAKTWDVVIVYAIDRFGRNSIEIAVNKQKLRKNGKLLISATQRTSENIDGTKNLDGILLENMYIGLAEYYSAELSQKVKRGLEENRRKGLFTGGPIPYGYKVIDKKIYVDEDKANVVRYIFQKYSEGMYAKDVINDLTSKGILFKGKPFIVNTILKMLRLEKYTGIARYGDEVYTDMYPRIISDELFERVGLILEGNRHGCHWAGTDFLLKGKLICGYCGKPIQGESGTSGSGHRNYYYKCSKRKKGEKCEKKIVRQDNLEEYVINTTLELLGNSKNIEMIADAVMEVHKQRMVDQSLINLLAVEKTETEKALSNLMKAIEQGIITNSTKARACELENKLADLNVRIQKEKARAQGNIKRTQVIEYLTTVIKKEPKQMLRLLIDKIILYDDKIEIYYNYINRSPSDKIPNDNKKKVLI